MPKGYQKSTTSVHLMNYHFIWCPKYRRPVLQDSIKERCKQLIEEKVNEMECKILKLRIMPDHVHLFIQGKPKLAPNNIIAGIKGYTSNMLRKEFPKLLKIPTLWTRSYFVSTAGNISMSTIQKYIQAQKGK
jgi:putative transposase